jgi:hypothetical protein
LGKRLGRRTVFEALRRYTGVMLQKGSRHGDESIWAQQNEE